MSDVIEDRLQPHVVEIAEKAEAYGLDFYNTEFILVSSDEMSALAAYGGFPTRYPHYSFGQDYESTRQSYRWGQSRIYEMVINSDPGYAYLMEGNLDIDQKLVIAHVYGHVDFFKNNIWFSHTNRESVQMMADHAVQVQRIIDRVGAEAVERWIDRCLCIQNLIDPYAPFRDGFNSKLSLEDKSRKLPEIRLTEFEPHRFEFSEDADVADYMNPDDYIGSQRSAYIRAIRNSVKFPDVEERDILAFLICHGRGMQDWQREILAIIREESYYFHPQGMTKIMNEGWAVFWHTTLMDDHATGDEMLTFADHHAGVVHWPKDRLNPYALGWKLFLHIKERWDKGRFGEEWERCEDRVERKNWDTKAMLGMQKIFEIRQTHNDVEFLNEFIDKDFVQEHLMFIYSEDRHGQLVLESNDWQDIKSALIHSMTFRGQPVLRVSNGNMNNRGELLICQDVESDSGEVLYDPSFDVLKTLAIMWGRSVTIRTATWEETVDPNLLTGERDYAAEAMGLI